MPAAWLQGVQALEDAGEAGALVTLATVRGHAPREAGAKMVVGLRQVWDTVGGGNLEATAVERARALLGCAASAPELLTLRLTDKAPNEYGRQCCGGEVTLLIEPLMTVRPSVAIFGVGHVGLALAQMLSLLNLDLHLVDSRAAQLTPERLATLPGQAARVRVHHSPIPEMTLAELPAGSHLVIMTHDHAEDLALCDAALRRPDLGFVGLIGSGVKWSRFREQLKSAGHSAQAISRMTSPIGIAGVRGKAPAVIALSVAAQLQTVIEAAQHAASNIASNTDPAPSSFPTPAPAATRGPL